MRTLKRIIGSATAKFAALLLTLGLFGGAWGATIQVSGTDSTALKDAVTAAAEGDTIELTADMTLTAAVTFGKQNLTLDLAGHTITVNIANRTWGIYNSGGSLTIKSSGEQIGTIVQTAGNAIQVAASGNVTIEGVTVSGKQIPIVNNGTLTVKDGAVISSQTNSAINNGGTGTVEIKEGGTVTATSGYAIDVKSGQCVISGGTVTAVDKVAIYVEGGQCEITGGTIKSETPSSISVKAGSTANVIVSGGTFSSDVSEFCVEGSNMTLDQETGLHTVIPPPTPVAKIGDTEYATLAAAVTAAKAGDTIKMIGAETLTAMVGITKNVTIDLNGQTITAASGERGAIQVYSSANVTITDNSDGASGKIIGNGATQGTLYSTAGTLTVEKGTIENTGTAFCITGGDVTIKGGKVTSSAGRGVYLYGNGKLNVTGGEINGATDGLATADSRIEATLAGTAKVTGTTRGLYVSGGTVTVEDGVEVSGASGVQVYTTTADTAKLIVKGGSVKGTSGYGAQATTEGVVEISGGQVVSETRSAIYANGGKVTISGTADIKGAEGANAVSATSGGSIKASGGYFSKSIATSDEDKTYLVDGYVCVSNDPATPEPWKVVLSTYTVTFKDGDATTTQTYNYGAEIENTPTEPADKIFKGWYLVGEGGALAEEAFTGGVTANITLQAVWDDAVAKIGDTKYVTLQAAVNAAQEGQTITLVADAVGSLVTIPSTVTFAPGSYDYTAYIGAGTSANPYTINNLSTLKAFRDDVNGGNNYMNKFVALGANIDLANEAWTPIGYGSKADGAGANIYGSSAKGYKLFRGVFDGKGFTISNLNVLADSTGDRVGDGFFGAVASPNETDKTVIKNLTINNAKVVGTENGFGNTAAVVGVLGNLYGKPTLDNVHVTGTVKVTGVTSVGGIAGRVNGDITNSSVIADDGSYIKATMVGATGGDPSWVGGIGGWTQTGLEITGCTVKNITIETAGLAAGGVLGILNQGGIIRNCGVENVTVKVDGANDTGAWSGMVVGMLNGNVTNPNYATDNTADVASVIVDGAGAAVAYDSKQLYGTKRYGGTVDPTYNPVAKVEANYYNTFDDAVTAAAGAKAITLLADVGDYTLASGTLIVTANGKSINVQTGEGSLIETSVSGDTTTYTIVAAVAKIGDTKYVTLQAAIAAVGDGETTIELLADAEFDYPDRSAYGTDGTTKLTINGNNHKLHLHGTNSDWSSLGLKNPEAVLAFTDVEINKTNAGTGTDWNTWALNISSPLEMTNVKIDRTLCVEKNATLNNVEINIADGHYGLWVTAEGQTVTVNGGSITATNGGRGIKIADQYVKENDLGKVTLNIAGMAFNTAAKAAILVSSTAGADITATNVDISNVAADSTNVVWVDEDWSEYYGKVKYNGQQTSNIIPEKGVSHYAATLSANGTWIDGYYKTLAKAITAVTPEYAAANTGYKLTLLKNSDETIPVAKALTITKNGYTAENVTADADAGYVRNETATAYIFFTGAVAKIGDTYYASLQAAAAAAQAGDTIELLADVADVGNISLKAGVTLDGKGNTISGDSAININAAGGTVQNVAFKNIHNSNSNKSAIYARNLTGTATVTGCSFDNCDWDAIQMTPKAGAVISITNNTFSDDTDDSIQQQRFVHIESAKNVDFTVTVTDNAMTGETKQEALEVYYFADPTKAALSGNYIEYPNKVCILSGTGDYAGELAWPQRSQADVDVDDLTAVAMIAQDEYTAKFYTTLAEAFAAAKLLDGDSVEIAVLSDLPLSQLSGASTVGKEVVLKAANPGVTTLSISGAWHLQIGAQKTTLDGFKLAFGTSGWSYYGFEGAFDLTVQNCTITGFMSCNGGESLKVLDSTFDFAGNYQLQVGNLKNLYVEGCTFTGGNRCAKVYSYGGGVKPVNAEFKDCKFTCTEQKKAAIEITLENSTVEAADLLNVTITNCEQTGCGTGEEMNLGDGLWNFELKGTNKGNGTVWVDGVQKYPFRVTFKNWDGEELATVNVPVGEVPVYSGETPTKPSDTSNVWIFSGWDPALTEVTDGEQTYTAQFSTAVAKIGDVYFATLQAAVDAAYGMTGDVTVEVIEDISGSATVQQHRNLNLVIDGGNHVFRGQFLLDGGGFYADDTVTIQNFKFVFEGSGIVVGHDGDKDAFVYVLTKGTLGGRLSDTHNITVKDCEFDGDGSGKQVVAVKATSGTQNRNFVLDNLTAKNVHSLAQLTAVTDATVTDCEVTSAENGINISGGGGKFTITGNKISASTTDGYGIRLKDSTSATVVLGDGNEIAAKDALVLGKNAEAGNKGKFSVTGGTYVGNIVKNTTSADATIQISGGFFSQPVAIGFCAEDYTPIEARLVYETVPDGAPYTVTKTENIVAQNTTTGAYYPTLASAVGAAENGQTVTLLKETAESFSTTKTVTIDLDGNTLTVNKNEGITVNANGALTITNGAIESTFTDILNANGGTITLTGTEEKPLTVNATNGAAIWAHGANADGIGVVTIDGAVVTGGAGNVLAFADVNGKVVVNSGELSSAQTALSVKGSIAEINGGEVKTTSSNFSAAYSKFGGKIVVDGGSVTGGGLVATANSTVEVKSGSVTVAAGKYAVLAHEGNATATITGGTVNGAVGAGSSNAGANNTLTIEDGTINGSVYREKGTVAITGGRFKDATGNADGIDRGGKFLVKDGDYYTLQEAVAVIDDTYYTTLQAAIAAAQDGDTVKLLADIALAATDAPVAFNNGKTFTLDLNGHSIQRTANSNYVLDIASGTSVTIVDSTDTAKDGTGAGFVKGTPVASGNKTNPASLVRVKGSLTLESGKLVSDYTCVKVDEDPGAGVFTMNGGALEVIPNDQGYTGQTFVVMNWSEATINGGNVTGNIQSLSYDGNKESKTSTTVINGGTFDPATIYLYLYDDKQTPVVNINNSVKNLTVAIMSAPEGYAILAGATTVGDVAYNSYTAVPAVASIGEGEGVTYYATLASAAERAAAGDTIKMLDDVTLSATVTFNKQDLTLDLAGHTIKLNVGGSVSRAIYNKGKLEIVDSDSEKNGKITQSAISSIYNDGGDLTINGVTVTGSSSLISNVGGELTVKGDSIISVSEYATIYTSGHVKIQSGTFTANTNYNIIFSVGEGGTFEISGGFFSQPVESRYCATDYYPIEARLVYETFPQNAPYTVTENVVAQNTTTGAYYPTLASAVAEAANNAEVKLLKDTTETFAVNKEGKVTIDLNDKTLTLGSTASGSDTFGLNVTKGDIEITNGKITTDTTDALWASGANATLTLGKDLEVTGSNSLLYAFNGGKIEVAGANLKATNSPNALAFATGAGSKIVVSDGEVFQSGVDAVTLSVAGGASAEISGGVVKNDASTTIAVRDDGSVITIKDDGKVESTANFVAGYARNGGKIVVDGGTVESANWLSLSAIRYGAAKGGEIVVNGGTINKAVGAYEGSDSKVTVTGGVIGDRNSWGVFVDNGASAVVSGGTVYGYASISGNGTGSLLLTGGRFSWNSGDRYTEEGKTLRDFDGDGLYTIVNEVVVTFDVAGGAPAPDSQTIAETEKATKPADDPTKEGFEFAGWTLNGAAYDFSQGVTKNITLTAAWSVAVASVTTGDPAATTYYASLKTALDYANANGGTVTLLENATLADADVLDVTGTVTLDLNGKKITNGSNAFTSPHDYLVAVKRGGNLTIVDGEGGGAITSDDLCVAVKLTVKGEAATGDDAVLTVGSSAEGAANDFSIKGHDYAISGNGNRAGTVVTINGGSISADTEAAIYQPQDGTLTINGGTIEGPEAVHVKVGTVTVNGGTLKGTADARAYEYFTNGVKPTGDALVIDSCNYPTGSKTPVAVVTGGTFDSTNGKGIGSYYGNGVTELASVTADRNTITIPDNEMWIENEEGGYLLVEAVVVTFDADGGTPAPAVQKIVKGTPVAQPETDPAKANFVFKGWTLDGADYDFETPVNENITIKAKWTAAVAWITTTDDEGQDVTKFYETIAEAIGEADEDDYIYLLERWDPENNEGQQAAIDAGWLHDEDYLFSAAAYVWRTGATSSDALIACATVQEAFDLVNDGEGDLVGLMKNVTEKEDALYLPCAATLNLNGYTLTGVILTDGDLTVVDERGLYGNDDQDAVGSIVMPESDSIKVFGGTDEGGYNEANLDGAIWANGVTVTVAGGRYSDPVVVLYSTGDNVVFAGGEFDGPAVVVDTEWPKLHGYDARTQGDIDAVVTVTGGFFGGKDDFLVKNNNAVNGVTLAIEGGYFKTKDARSSQRTVSTVEVSGGCFSYNNLQSTFIVEGYVVVDNEDEYKEVYPYTVQEEVSTVYITEATVDALGNARIVVADTGSVTLWRSTDGQNWGKVTASPDVLNDTTVFSVTQVFGGDNVLYYTATRGKGEPGEGNVVGVQYVHSPIGAAIVSAPWVAIGSKEAGEDMLVTLADLVSTAPLTQDTKLQLYTDAGMEEWRLTGGKVWEPDPNSRYTAKQEADETYLSRGTGVRLQFFVSAEQQPIYLVGEVSTSSEPIYTIIPAYQSTYVASPNPGPLDLNKLDFAEGTIGLYDMIRVEYDGVSLEYEYDGEKWGYWAKNQNGQWFFNDNSTIPAGVGFQYYNEGSAKKIAW